MRLTLGHILLLTHSSSLELAMLSAVLRSWLFRELIKSFYASFFISKISVNKIARQAFAIETVDQFDVFDDEYNFFNLVPRTSPASWRSPGNEVVITLNHESLYPQNISKITWSQKFVPLVKLMNAQIFARIKSWVSRPLKFASIFRTILFRNLNSQTSFDS